MNKMTPVEKFNMFLKVCKYAFVVLLAAKLGSNVEFSWWFVAVPVAIPVLIFYFLLNGD